MKTILQQLAWMLEQYRNGHSDKETIQYFVQKNLPSGSGLDGYIGVDFWRCSTNRITIDLEFHHMNEVGMYDGWTNHSVVVTPAFAGIDIRVTGKNRNDIKEHIAETFYSALMEPYSRD